MELLGIVLSVPMAFVSAIVYGVVLNHVVRKWKGIRSPFIWASCVVIASLSLEVVALLMIGTLQLREIVGPAYFSVHLAIFFLTLPSVVNLMKLQTKMRIASRWYLIGPVCAIIGLAIVLLQYGVSEALYGIDGTGGPYGKP